MLYIAYGRRVWVHAVASLMLLVGLHGFVGGSTTDQFVGPLGFVKAVGHLLVRTMLLGIVYRTGRLVSDTGGLFTERGERTIVSIVLHRH